jgi:hypothetical protein
MNDASDNPLDLYTLSEAAKRFFPNTPIVGGDLLAAYRRKQLRVTKVGQTTLVSGAQIMEYIEGCRGNREGHTSPSKAGGQPSGTSSGTEAGKSAQAALQAEIDRIKSGKPKKSSRNTSPKSTKFQENVVPLRSV